MRVCMFWGSLFSILLSSVGRPTAMRHEGQVKINDLSCSLAILEEIPCNPLRADYTYVESIGGWLKYHKVPTNFQDAYSRCIAEGAVVASPLNESYLIAMILSAFGKDGTGTDNIFTGIHAKFSKSDFASAEGVPLWKIPVEWAAGEPDNCGDSEACTMMTPQGTLADVRCNDTFPYICYKRKTGDLAITRCGTHDMEYTYENRTGSCYKLHTVARTWRNAHKTCMAEGGSLAIINSDLEAQALKELYARFPDEKFTPPGFLEGVVAIGNFDFLEEGVWLTIEGQTLKEAGYDTFQKGDPSNTWVGGVTQDCGGMYRNGLLDDIHCDLPLIPFICEMKPYSLQKNTV